MYSIFCIILTISSLGCSISSISTSYIIFTKSFLPCI
nr:MAG TPA: hypothetical protein [Caudoviricetes sp.]